MKKIENINKGLDKDDLVLLLDMYCGRPLQAATLMKRIKTTNIRVFQKRLDKLVRTGMVLEQEYNGETLYRISPKTRNLLKSVFKTTVYKCKIEELLGETT